MNREHTLIDSAYAQTSINNNTHFKVNNFVMWDQCWISPILEAKTSDGGPVHTLKIVT